jgi:hypothetical protein
MRDDVWVCLLAFAALAALWPSPELGVALSCASLAFAGRRTKQGSRIDFAFFSAVRACVLHARKLTERWLLCMRNFKVAHYRKFLRCVIALPKCTRWRVESLPAKA